MSDVLNDLDVILGRPPAETAAADGNALTTEEARPMPAKEEIRAHRKAERKARRTAKNGVSFFLVLLIIISINAFWLGFIRYHVIPDYRARIDEVTAEKDDAIRRIQAVYKVREEDFEKRLTACEEKQAELEEMYQNAILIIEKYGGDLSFLENKTEEVKE